MTDTLRIATRDIIKHTPGDDPEALRYRGDLTTQEQLRFSRGITWWPFGDRRGQFLSGTMEIDNRSGAYDSLLETDARDQPITIRIVPDVPFFVEGQEIALATAVSDTLVGDSDRIRVAIADPLARYDKALVRDRAEAEETITGKLTPVLFGVGRNIRAPMVSIADPIFRVSDGPLSGISIVRSRAFPLELATPQWGMALGGAGFELFVNPIGPITCDASTSGEAMDVGEPDLLDGNGALDQPFDGQSGANSGGTTTDMPPGWQYRTTGNFSQSGSVASDTLIESRLSGGERHTRMQITRGTDLSLFMEYVDVGSPAFAIEGGATYRWSVERVGTLVGATVVGGTILNRTSLKFAASPTAPSQARTIAGWKALDPSAEPGVYSGIWTAPNSANGESLFFVLTANQAQNGIAGIKNVTFTKVPEPLAEDALEGITLRDFITEIVNRSNQPISSVSLTDLDQISPSSPPPEIGYWIEDPVTALSMIRAPLDSYTADVLTDREGITRFIQLLDLTSETAAYEVGEGNIIGNPRFQIDTAPGLTSTATARPNWFVFRDSDFVDDDFDNVTLEVRQRFSEVGQFTVRATIPDDFPPLYLHAKDAGPLFTLYDDPDEAQAEIQRVIDFYSHLRFFVTVDVKLNVLPNPGDVITFTWSRYGFEAGKKMRVIGVDDNLRGEANELTFTLRLHG